jgi:CRP/FNR family cyclic AMP-dependent transcriptional regulator
MADTDVAQQSLSKNPLFAHLSKRVQRSLAASARVVHHRAGAPVMEEGDAPMGFHLIIEGTATVRVHGEDRRSLKPGDHFGLVSMLDGKPRTASVHADSDLTTVFIAPWAFRPVLQQEPALAYDLLPVLCELLRSAENAAIQPA